MNASFQSVLFEMALCPAGSLNLSFHDKLLTVIRAELSGDCVGLFAIEGDVTSWDWHSVAVEDLSCMVLMKDHVPLRERTHERVHICRLTSQTIQMSES